MPSRGNPKILVRVTPDLLNQIRDAIASNNAFRADEPYDLSEWVRQAIRERLDKLKRSRKASKRKVKPVADQGEGQQPPAEVVAETPPVAEVSTPIGADQAGCDQGGLF